MPTVRPYKEPRERATQKLAKMFLGAWLGLCLVVGALGMHLQERTSSQDLHIELIQGQNVDRNARGEKRVSTGGLGELGVLLHIEGILPKGPYLPCVSMACRAILARYPRYEECLSRYRGSHDENKTDNIMGISRLMR